MARRSFSGGGDHAALRQAASGRAKEHRYTDLENGLARLGRLTASAKATASLAEALRAKAEAGPYD